MEKLTLKDIIYDFDKWTRGRYLLRFHNYLQMTPIEILEKITDPYSTIDEWSFKELSRLIEPYV